jgi:hypothetical protein
MHIASALRRKRDEIVATIAAYEARIDAARMDLAALDQAARLLDPEAGRDAAAIHREFEWVGKLEETPSAECEVWETERTFAMDQLAPPGVSAKGSDDRDSARFKSIGVRERRITGEVARTATHAAREQIPEEFLYLDWP